MLLLLAVAAQAHVPVVFITNPDEDWCAVIESVAGGDYVLLEPGDYVGPCDVISKVSEPPGEVTIVQSLDPTQPARILHDGSSPYLLSLAGDVGLFMDLDFGDVPEGVVAVELRGGTNLGVRNARFAGPGTAVQQVDDIDVVGLRDCQYQGATGVALDLGCEGACAPGTVEISNNVVDGGSPTFRVHGGQVAVVDNTAIGAQGTLLALTVDEGRIEANTLEAEVPLVVNGWADVVNNVLFGTVTLDDGWFAGNTLIGDVALGSGERDHNAVVGGAPGPTDIGCDAACFVDLAGRDLYPAPDGPLTQDGVGPDLPLDWCGRERDNAPAVGAFAFHGADASPGPLVMGFKSRVDCRLPQEPEPLDTATTAATLTLVDDGEGCGCTATPTGSGAGLWAALGLAGLGLRRSRGPRHVVR